MLLAPRERVERKEGGHEEAEERNHFIRRKAGLADDLDGGISEYPKGEAREREANCLQIRDLFLGVEGRHLSYKRTGK